MTGSFNPIDVGEWSDQVYVGQTEALFSAINLHDREAVTRLITDGVDVNRRDHVGRKALHLAILVRAEDIACDLVDTGAQMMARLVDGRNALHLAAQMDMPEVIRKLVERSGLNKEKVEKEGKGKGEEREGTSVNGGDGVNKARPSSEDDWTSEDDGLISMDTDEDLSDDKGEAEEEGGEKDKNDEEAEEAEDNGDQRQEEGTLAVTEGDVLDDDNATEPDILDINLPDWDLGFTPLCHGVFSGSAASVEALLKAGVDPVLPNKGPLAIFHPLAITIMKEDEKEACRIAERLISAGASSAVAGTNMVTIFHQAVHHDKLKLVPTILKCDPNADTVLNFPSEYYDNITFPIVNVIHSRRYAMLATLLAQGAKLVFKEEDIPQAGYAIQLTLYHCVLIPIFQGLAAENSWAMAKVDSAVDQSPIWTMSSYH